MRSRVNPDSVRKNVKKAVRILSFKKKDCHTETLFENLRILNFDLYNEFTIGKFMWTLGKNYLPMCTTTLLKSDEIVVPGHENNFNYQLSVLRLKEEVSLLTVLKYGKRF